MATLADAMNTWDPALDCLAKEGWEVWTEEWIEDSAKGDKDITPNGWYAKRTEQGEVIELASDNPLSLLGLAVIWQRWGYNWKKVDLPEHVMNRPHFICTYNSETDKVTRKLLD